MAGVTRAEGSPLNSAKYSVNSCRPGSTTALRAGLRVKGTVITSTLLLTPTSANPPFCKENGR